jgi:hypothetical protein
VANKRQTKGTVVALAEQLIAGTNKHLANMTQVPLAGGSFTPAQVVEKLQALANLRRDVDASKASTKAKLAVEKTEVPALRTFLGALVTFIKAAFGNQPDVLADFGLHPPKTRATQTAEAKMAAAEKRKATRAARHTMSAKKKSAIKGAVTGIQVTPIASPQPAATAPSSPAAPATSTGTTATAPTPPRTA